MLVKPTKVILPRLGIEKSWTNDSIKHKNSGSGGVYIYEVNSLTLAHTPLQIKCKFLFYIVNYAVAHLFNKFSLQH
jgi:hypothetical protein